MWKQAACPNKIFRLLCYSCCNYFSPKKKQSLKSKWVTWFSLCWIVFTNCYEFVFDMHIHSFEIILSYFEIQQVLRVSGEFFVYCQGKCFGFRNGLESTSWCTHIHDDLYLKENLWTNILLLTLCSTHD